MPDGSKLKRWQALRSEAQHIVNVLAGQEMGARVILYAEDAVVLAGEIQQLGEAVGVFAEDLTKRPGRAVPLPPPKWKHLVAEGRGVARGLERLVTGKNISAEIAVLDALADAVEQLGTFRSEVLKAVNQHRGF